jgi:hypothetical protein
LRVPVDDDEDIKSERQALSATLQDMRHPSMEPVEDPLHNSLAQFADWGRQIPPSQPTQDGDFPYDPELAIDEVGNATPYLESANSIVESEAPRIQAFAKLEFDDGQFYMNTYAIELGRDVRAARAAIARDIEASQKSGSIHNGPMSSGGNASQNANRVKPSGSGIVGGSVVSEKAGIIGIDPDPQPRRKKKGKNSKSNSKSKSKSTSSSSHPVSRRNQEVKPPPRNYQTLAMQSLYDQPHPVDAENLLPSPDEIPLVPIHPPTDTEEASAAFRGISRKHVRIAFNFQKHLFEVEIKGRNGAFVDDQFYNAGTIKSLKSGSYLQIGGVGVRFWLPDVAVGATGAEGSELDAEPSTVGSGSLEEEDSDDMGIRRDSMDEEMEEVQESVETIPQTGKGGKGKARQKQPPQPQPDTTPTVAMPPKKRGPGRPPKDGISSKREKAEAARAAKLAARKEANGGVTPPPSGKIKMDTPRSVSNPTVEAKPEKRKYTKRRKSEIDPQDNGEEEELEVEEAPKGSSTTKKERSASPDYGKESDYTPEQLQKPKDSYQFLVHDLLKSTPPHQMDLKDIYRGLKKKYPYYVFKVDTPGWQSSVRHNLNQIPSFRKVSKAGKGWLWGLDPDHPLPMDRKRRASPPPLPPPSQSYQSQGPQLLRYPPPPGGPMPPPPLPPQQQPHPGNGFAPPPPGVAPLASPPMPSYHSPYQSPYGPPSAQPHPPTDHFFVPQNGNHPPPLHPNSHSQPHPQPPQPISPPIWRTVTHIPDSISSQIRDFKGKICMDPAHEVTIDSAIDRAMGFKKGGEANVSKAEMDLVGIMTGLVEAWGWKGEMVEEHRGVKRGRESDDDDGREEDIGRAGGGEGSGEGDGEDNENEDGDEKNEDEEGEENDAAGVDK